MFAKPGCQAYPGTDQSHSGFGFPGLRHTCTKFPEWIWHPPWYTLGNWYFNSRNEQTQI